MSGMENGNNCYKNEMSSVEEFKSAIVRIRDILRKEGITGMDSMRTICIYVLARLLSNEKCIELEIPQEFSWENIVGLYKKEGGQQLALDYFYNPGNPDRDCLLSFFDTKFKTQKFAFDVKKLLNHKEIIDILNKINLEHVDYHMDIIGYIYEQHLKTGSSSASRDLGQFFTDRSICSYMIQLCKPKMLSSGLIETICDPTMGTGGFLSASIKYLNKKYKLDWNIQQDQIYGFDIDPKVTGLANLNVFAESSVAFKNLENEDTLHNGLSLTGYDVILANMPFGIKGLKHADVCKRVNELRIIGTKSEPLFLQLMMVSLNKGGRCAVVVPDGVLINSSKLHDGTRKYLLDNFELHRVIKMDGTFFMNTGIKPSILFFEKTGKPTKNIEFWEVSKNDKNEVIEKMIVKIDRDQLDKSYTLDVRKFIKKEEVVVNTEYEMVKLGDVIEKLQCGSNKNDLEKGEYPFYMSNGISQYANTYQFDGEYVLMARCGTHNNSQYYVNGKFSASDFTYVIKPKEKLNAKFLYYYLKPIDWTEWQTGTVMKGIRKEVLNNLEIPLPSLEIQQKIVEILDRIYESNKIAEGMISNIRERMTDVIRVTDERGFKKVKLNDVCKVDFGDRITQKKDTGNKYPVYGSGGETFRTDKFNRTGKTCKIGRFAISESNMVMFVNGPYWLLDSGFTVSSSNVDKMTNEYLWFYLIINKNTLAELSRGSCQNNIIMDDFYNFEITLPPLKLQKDIVRRLENYENQIKSLEESIRDADDNARFILDSYFKKDIPLEASENNSEVSVSSIKLKQQEEPECIVEPPPPKRKIIKKVNVKEIN